MSSAVAYPRTGAARRSRRERAPARPRSAWRLQGLSILGFSILGLLAGQRFVSLLAHPPVLRVAVIAAVAAALAAGLLMSDAIGGGDRRAGALRLAATLLALYAAMRIAGIAGRQLLPWHWDSLAGSLSNGTSHLDGLWPYTGHSAQARIDIQACVAGALIGAAALTFWPGERHRSARRLLALGLLLTLYVAGAANEARTGWQVQGLIALAALYVWGWSTRTRRAEDGRAAGWLLGGAILSLLLAGALSGGMPLINVRAWEPFGEPGATTAFNWNQTYGPLPWSTSPATMAEAVSRSPHLWRARELDSFDGRRFFASGEAPAEPRGLATEPHNRPWITTTTFTVRGLEGRDLLSPGQILTAREAGAFTATLGSPAPDGTLAAPNTLAGGARYTITAYAPQPTVSELREDHGALPAGFRPYVRFDVPTTEGPPVEVSTATAAGRARILASPYADVYVLARRLASGATSAYELATRIQGFLHRGFTYDTHPPLTEYPLAGFLLKERRGYCQQFSGAMALLLRMDGVPARVASGFLPGAHGKHSATYAFHGGDAHAWVEVFFAGIGWVPFDPTPGQFLKLTLGKGGSELSAAQLAAREKSKPTPLPGSPTASSPTHRAGGGEGTGLLIAAGLATLALALSALLMLRKRLARRRTKALQSSAALEELTTALRRLGLEPPAGTTLAELEESLAKDYGSGALPYLRALRELRYSRSKDARRPSAADRRRLRLALTSGRGPLVRLRGLLALGPRIV